MELVSASKMRKAIENTLKSRPYANTLWNMVLHSIREVEGAQLLPLLLEREVKRSLYVVISSNRGLCGGFNNAVSSKVLSAKKNDLEMGVEEVSLITFGRRGRDLLLRSGAKPFADFVKNDKTHSVREILPLARMIIDLYEKKEIDKVCLVYTHFVSSVRQQVRIKQILPFTQEELESGEKNEQSEEYVYVYEPSIEEVFQALLPRCVEIELFQAILESESSEYSARMLAMHNASEAATDILNDLRLTYNQIRQTGITQEMAEISSAMGTIT